MGAVCVLKATAPAASTITDTFDRANSASNPNPSSDGGTWIADSGVWGIQSNRLYLSDKLTTGSFLYAANAADNFRALRRAWPASSVDLTITNFRANGNAYSAIFWAATGAIGSRLFANFDAGGSVNLRYWDGTSSVSVGTWTVSPWNALAGSGNATLRIAYDASTGVATLYQGGVNKGTVTVPSNQRPAGTDIGVAQLLAYGDTASPTFEQWENLNVV